MLVKSGEGMKEYRVIRNGVGEILMVNKFGPDETANRCKMVAELNIEPGQCIGYHAHVDDIELFYMLEGELICVEDGEELTLLPGDMTSTSCGEKHQLINRSDKLAKVLAIVIR
ncbi:MAG: cupin domain-containing protein [Clostridia bacterium]|nr:cupin domain-containing protein [Clostridia bacterium]